MDSVLSSLTALSKSKITNPQPEQGAPGSAMAGPPKSKIPPAPAYCLLFSHLPFVAETNSSNPEVK